MTLLEYNTQLY